MLWHVWQRARQARSLAETLVATDAEEIMQTCRELGIPGVLTSTDPRGWGPARWIAPARPKR